MERKRKLLIEIIQDILDAQTVSQLSLLLSLGAKELVNADESSLIVKKENDFFYVKKDENETEAVNGFSSLYEKLIKEKKDFLIKKSSLKKCKYLPLAFKEIMKGVLISPFKGNLLSGGVALYWKDEHDVSSDEKYLIKALSKALLISLEKIFLIKAKDQKIEELSDKDLQRTIFLMNVTHELQTPIASILGWLSLLKNNELSKEENYEALVMMEKSALMEKRIVNDLLDTASIMTGKLNVQISHVNIKNAIENCCFYLFDKILAKKIKIIKNISINDEEIQGDPQRMEQIIWNLISNAIRYSNEEAEIILSLYKSKNLKNIIFTIKDYGSGIDPDFLPKIFLPFTQQNQTKNNHQGLGLGLSIVKYLTEAQKGSISCKSELGKGTEFVLRFPFDQKI